MRSTLRLVGAAAFVGAFSLMLSDKTAPPPVDPNSDPLKGIRVTPGAKPPAAAKPAAVKPAPVKPAPAGAPPRAAAPKIVSGEDTLMQAMRDELARSKQLGLASLDQPYFIEYSADELQNYSVSASLGALLANTTTRVRIPRVRVRVGDYAFDNTNYVFTDYYAGVRYDPDQLPLDDNYQALRRVYWLATDRAYKTALEAIGRKRAALKNVTQQDELPDFWKAAPVQKVSPLTRVPVDTDRWISRVRMLSDVFSAYPDVLGSSVSFDAIQTHHYYLNSEGTAVRNTDPIFFLQVRASGQAGDGMTIRDALSIESLDINTLPSEAELRKQVVEVAEHVKALKAAPVGETYSGPVLVEGAAAPQMIGELLGAGLILSRKPVGEPGRPIPTLTSDLEGRIGSRILPETMDVIDDPSLKTWNNIQLIGAYEVDEEGVIPQKLTVVEKGRLKSFLHTRQPVKGATESNGRARLPGSFGARTAVYSNLIVKTSDGVSGAELKAKLIEMVKQRSKPYGIIVRKTDYPSSASNDELRRIAGSGQSGGRPASLPLLVYRVYPDGKEELVRGLRYRGLNVRALKDIMATGNEPQLHQYMFNLAPFALMGAGGYVAPVSVIAPAMLFEDLELEAPREDMPKLPVVPPPPLSAAAR